MLRFVLVSSDHINCVKLSEWNGLSCDLIIFAELYGLAVAVVLTVTALIVLSVVLIIVIIKCQRLRRKKIQHMSQGETDHRSCQEAKSEPAVYYSHIFQQSSSGQVHG